MTEIKARLDEIAKEAAELNYSYRNERVIRTAIYKAIELVLTAEPSDKVIEAGTEAFPPVWELYEDGKAPLTATLKAGFRAMSSALLEEIKT